MALPGLPQKLGIGGGRSRFDPVFLPARLEELVNPRRHVMLARRGRREVAS
jgi:hypothetical protein